MSSTFFIADAATHDFSIDKELSDLSDDVKNELQGVKGLIRRIQMQNPLIKHLKDQYEKAKSSFSEVSEKNIDDLLSRFEAINRNAQNAMSLDFAFLARDFPHIHDYPACHRVVTLLTDEKTPTRTRLQYAAMLQKHVEGSLAQSRKSRAGKAGEDALEAILIASGLKLDVSYAKQFKMPSGSDADFIIPAANAGDLHEVDIIIAVQISTNDRVRLASSELKSGTVQYIATFNGFKASTKGLKDIGDQNIRKELECGRRMICSERARQDELRRIEDAMRKKRAEKLDQRREYFTKYARSFSEFSTEIARKYGGKAPVS